MRIIKFWGAILFVLMSGYVVMGETNPPVLIGPRTILTNAAPVYLKNKFFAPPALGGASLPQSPEAATNFLALLGRFEVADTHGTVGRDYVMTMLNTDFNIQTRSGAQVQTNW